MTTIKQQTKPSAKNLIKRFEAYQNTLDELRKVENRMDACPYSEEREEEWNEAKNKTAKAYKSFVGALQGFTGKILCLDCYTITREELDAIIAAY